MEQLIQVESNIYYLDSRHSGQGVSGVYFVVGEGLTLIETSTSLMAKHILEAVHDIGFEEKDVKRAIVTHIHLDHSGAAGWLVNRLPHLQVYVHERGLRHLNDPSKLIESAKILYGDLDSINALHGEILPVPAKNLISITDEELDIGEGITLKTFDAPGHAPHHMGIFEPQSGCLFTGEALGHYNPDNNTLKPAATPPSFDFEAAKNTIRKIEHFGPRTICFSQFGQHRDPDYVIEQSLQQLDYFHEFIKIRFDQGLNTSEIIRDITNDLSKGNNVKMSPTDNIFLSIVLGFETYFRRRGEVRRP